MKSLEDIKRELLNDPATRAEYERQLSEFDMGPSDERPNGAPSPPTRETGSRPQLHAAGPSAGKKKGPRGFRR
jgi:hypothetical protein